MQYCNEIRKSNVGVPSEERDGLREVPELPGCLACTRVLWPSCRQARVPRAAGGRHRSGLGGTLLAHKLQFLSPVTCKVKGKRTNTKRG